MSASSDKLRTIKTRIIPTRFQKILIHCMRFDGIAEKLMFPLRVELSFWWGFQRERYLSGVFFGFYRITYCWPSGCEDSAESFVLWGNWGNENAWTGLGLLSSIVVLWRDFELESRLIYVFHAAK